MISGYGRAVLTVGSLLGLILSTIDLPRAWAQAGHSVTGSQVVISGANHWRNWTFPDGTLLISPTGEVQPQSLEKNTNAVFDIVEYLRFNPPASLGGKDPEEIVLADALQGGSNIGDLVNIVDGDMETYWQPETFSGDGDLASQWWMVVDLGRLVFAKELVIRFAEDGDPFLLFDVLISDGLKPTRFQNSDTPAYKTVLRTLSPNKSQRVFTIDLTKDQALVEAAPVRFVQILVTGTDGALGTEVSLEEYDLLDDANRGDIQYFKRQPDGREVPVRLDQFELLDETRQGSIRYYRQEVPRLAELEVLNEGDELIAGILARGGVISTTTSQPLALRKFIDGDLTSFNRVFYGVSSAVAEPELEVLFDLGSFYWIDAYRVAFNRFFPSYRIDFSDGSLAPDGSIRWQTLVSQEPDRPQGAFEGAEFEPVKARFGRFQWTLDPVGARAADISELQFYGQGFQPEVSMTSDLIRLGGSRNLLSIEWDANTPPGTEVRIQTRTGNELGENLTYFNKDGTQVTEEQYGKLLSIFKGDIIAEEVPGGDWSDFSEPYENAEGSPVNSPSPREFLEVRATLVSEDAEISPSLRSVRLNFSSPVAQNLLGEISPVLVDQLGVKNPFSFFVRPQFTATDPGFDELLLVAPSNMELSLMGLFGAGEGDFGEGDGALPALENVEIVPTGSDSLHVRFGEIVPQGAIDVLRLDFETSLFVTGAVLRASLRHSGQEGGGSWQRVDPGDALPQIISNTTTLVSSIKQKSLLTDIEVSPAFSPNGDGINDQALFAFKVVRVGDDSPVEVSVHDLNGRRVRLIAEQRPLSTGLYEIGWDGRDEHGNTVPPGLYFVQLSIDTDTDGANVKDGTVLRTVAVSY
ncbi:MAG: hypothetical protein GKR89_18520 [Candidatus Latescibacteria bacterium]|nr:hypothetical protein [Candidatus Latescibacterota bacterium]